MVARSLSEAAPAWACRLHGDAHFFAAESASRGWYVVEDDSIMDWVEYAARLEIENLEARAAHIAAGGTNPPARVACRFRVTREMLDMMRRSGTSRPLLDAIFKRPPDSVGGVWPSGTPVYDPPG